MTKKIVILILIILTFSIFYLSSYLFEIVNENNYMTNIFAKQNLLNTNERRLILVGGSSFGFSVDSSMLENDINYDVINYGLHAGLGIEFMLDDISKYTRDGDILILGFEYTLYFGEKDDSLILLTNNITNNFSNVFIEKYLYRLNSTFKNLYYYISENKTEEDLIYRANVTNSNGDIISHLEKENVNFNKKIEIKLVQDPLLEIIDEFIKDQEKKNVRIFFTFPPIPETYYEYNKDSIEEIANILHKYFSEYVISNHLNYVLDDNYFYDSIYHLNMDGIVIRSSFLIEDLKSVLDIF